MIIKNALFDYSTGNLGEKFFVNTKNKGTIGNSGVTVLRSREAQRQRQIKNVPRETPRGIHFSQKWGTLTPAVRAGWERWAAEFPQKTKNRRLLATGKREIGVVVNMSAREQYINFNCDYWNFRGRELRKDFATAVRSSSIEMSSVFIDLGGSQIRIYLFNTAHSINRVGLNGTVTSDLAQRSVWGRYNFYGSGVPTNGIFEFIIPNPPPSRPLKYFFRFYANVVGLELSHPVYFNFIY